MNRLDALNAALGAVILAAIVALASGCQLPHGGEVTTSSFPPGVKMVANAPPQDPPPKPPEDRLDGITDCLRHYDNEDQAELRCDCLRLHEAQDTDVFAALCPAPATRVRPVVEAAGQCPDGHACMPQDDYHAMQTELDDLRNDVSPDEVRRLANENAALEQQIKDMESQLADHEKFEDDVRRVCKLKGDASVCAFNDVATRNEAARVIGARFASHE